MLTETQRAKIAEIRKELEELKAEGDDSLLFYENEFDEHCEFLLNLCAELTQKLNRLEGGK